MDRCMFISLLLLAILETSRGQISRCFQDQWQCEDGFCIPDLLRCDGQGDCLDGSDEMNCPGSSDCPRGQFACLDTVGCVDTSARCDGQIQCPTGSDEENCPAVDGCLDSEWMCQNHICIPEELRCNGQDDCMDNSDEDDCGVCTKNSVRCLNGTCISGEKKCDGQFDCPDGSDEPLTCGRICAMNNGGCSSGCFDEPWGTRCECPAGYSLSPNGLICEDLDECATPFPPCPHYCINTAGSYFCHCRDGFKLWEGTTCLASGNGTRLLMVQRSTMGLLNVKSQQFEVIQTSVFDPVAMAFDAARGWYYWADRSGKIYKSDGQQSWTAYSGEPGIIGLACDWLNGNLFWTNQFTKSIHMQASDGKSYTTVLSKNISPSDSMFWINTGPYDRETIEKSWMDGSGRSSLTIITAQSAHSLTADVAAMRLYWISDFKGSIETVMMDGSGRYSFTGLFSGGPALSLAVFESVFYWVDDRGLWQVAQNRPNQKKLLTKTELPLLAVYHELQQPQGPSACGKTYCQLCQLTKSNSEGYICTCPNSKVLLPDGSCDYPRFLYNTATNVHLVEYRGRDVIDTKLFTAKDGILSFDLDLQRDWLYWVNQTGHIQRTSHKRGNTEVVPVPLPVCFITVDQNTGSVFWVSCDQNSIGTAANKYPQRLYRTTRAIRDLHLDWMAGLLYWLEDDRVLGMSMTGGKAKELLKIAGGFRESVAFDLRANSLLWNSKQAGLAKISLLQEKSHKVGRRWNISGSVAAALEPYLLTVSDDVINLWDQRDGSLIKDMTVQDHVFSAVAVIGRLLTELSYPACNEPSVFCRHSSVCLPKTQLCDGKNDCPEGDDEEFCVGTCPSKEDFRCRDRRSCISRNLVCDGRSHCRDGSDEVDCSAVSSLVTEASILKCRLGSKLCRDGRECVLYSHVCDGEEDCSDGSDELECDVPQATTPKPKNSQFTETSAAQSLPPCVSPSVRCPSAHICITPQQLCNGKKDCPDGSDEKTCLKKCPLRTDFLCKNRQSCVSKSQVCDGRRHCSDGSDEVACSNVAAPAPVQTTLKCRLGSRLCQDGTECVLYSHICDGERDCRDGSDEMGCDSAMSTNSIVETSRLSNLPAPIKPFTAPPTKPPCSSPSVLCPGSSVCLSPAQRCDGKKDCPDGSDEKCLQRCLYRTDFLCKDRRSCISKNQVCDGRSDCYDGSDELNCPSVDLLAPQKSALKCRVGSRLCQDGTECVLYSHICDGERDCRDGSDEIGCDVENNAPSVGDADSPSPSAPFTEPPTKSPCTSPSVLCPGSSVCLSPAQRCDGKKDCPDGSDEKCLQKCPYRSDFLCKDRQSCVFKSQVCDGRSDCYDGSDELNCPSVDLPAPQKSVLKCRLGSRLCQDGTECVLYSHVCDGDRDCRDGSDELGCESASSITVEKSTLSDSPASKKLISEPPTKPPCSSPSVLCPGSSVCLSPAQRCDGKKDCPDGSDEKCLKKCPYLNDFLCKDRRSCVSKSQVCNGRSDCYDGSDELNCQSVDVPAPQKSVLKCRLGSRLCQDGTECVLYSHVCDGDRDCRDGSDELGCDAAETDNSVMKNPNLNNPSVPLTEPPTKPPCSSPSVLCPGSSVCLSPAQRCDGKKDCPDGSDEKCLQKCPYWNDFLCKDRRSCISKNQVCDGRSDCYDGSDELNCQSVNLPAPQKSALKCRLGSRLCQDGIECVLYSHVCDGEKDCRDGSDEKGCDPPLSNKPFTESPTKPPCSSPSVLCPGSSVCLSPAQRCDGKKDCPDGSDEKCLQRCPYWNDFLCKDRRSCISRNQVCDGQTHCYDGSDEVGCSEVVLPTPPKSTLKCRLGSRLCQDGTECVLYSHVCDGERDCRDGSDELGCDAVEMATSTKSPSTWPPCSSPKVLCPGSSTCILPAQLCDGREDCPDGSDEDCVKKCADQTDFVCKDRRSCVSRTLVCDGSPHCLDGSDELNCPNRIAPAPNTQVLACRVGSKLCDDGTECVLYSHLCDGEDDCADGSDEQGCTKTCKQGEFQCAHGKMCIPEAQVCDGRSHCRDNSDEMNCWKATKTCQHRCADGKRCLPKKLLCDGERDCPDGSDELGCDAVIAATGESTALAPALVCIAPSVRCPGSTLCILQQQMCDGQRDCPDGSDENGCVLKCENPNDFLCSNQRKCIEMKEVCDGQINCPDGSDEKLCSRQKDSVTSSNMPSTRSEPLKCRRGFKPCKDGLECVMYSHVCDGEKDCKDGSDEVGCAAKCKEGEFRCSHGSRCVPQSRVCDGQYDCQDRSDEMDCSSRMEGCHHHCDNKTRCIPDTFLCDGEKDCADGSDEEKCDSVTCSKDQYKCVSGQCVSDALRCDGYADCSDRSDEAGCSRPPRCPPQLKCPHSHECLQKEWLCDGEEDCKDGSDEMNCNTPPAKCRSYQWQCRDSAQCIPVLWRCDGTRDCYNGMDEDRCERSGTRKNCPSHLYQCGSGECIDPKLLCNGLSNCVDGSDEGLGCGQRNCSSPSAPQCDHHCVSTPTGPTCFCASGYRPQYNTQTCVDVDECNSEPRALCEHICLNTQGSHTCHCHPGFYLEPDNKSCKTKDEPLLLASVQSELLLFGVHSGTLRVFSLVSQPVFSLDYHWAQQRVYWLSPDYQSVRFADMNNPKNKKTLIKGVKSDFLAVDWVGNNLYWVDGLVGQILAVKLSNITLKSQDFTVVLGEDLEQPSSLVLLPHKGLMLWSEIGSKPQIEQSGMDGSQRKVVVSSDLSWPVSLAYDLLDNRMYWADEKLRCIGSASLDGDNIKIMQLAETPNPFSVVVFNDRVFWSDTKRRAVRSAEKNSGKDQKVLLKRPGQPFGLKLMHALSQPAVSQPCDQLACSHLCLLAPAASSSSEVSAPIGVCRCPKGLLLSKDKITCSMPTDSSFALFLSRNTIYQIYLRSMRRDGVSLKKMPSNRPLALPNTNEALELDVSIRDLSLYVAYSGQGSVDVLRLSSSRSRQELTQIQQILQLKDDVVTALAVDWVTLNLYWSSSERPDIHVTSRYETHTTSLLQGSLMGTTSIALHPPMGRLCYTAIVRVSGKAQTEVVCAWMDGRNKATLWRKSSIPTSLVFSDQGNMIYWADTGEGVINSIALDGTGYKQFTTGPDLLISFTHTANIFLWITLGKDVTRVWFTDGLQPKQLWFETKTSMVKIRAFSNDTQTGANSCSKMNGDCKHLCLPYPGGRTCKCGRGYLSVNITSCAPLPPCPAGEKSCLNGDKCISSSKFCDRQIDCPDQSDEQDCPSSNTASLGSKSSEDQTPQNTKKNAVLPVNKDAASCDLQHCSGHGRCLTEGKVTRCQCQQGYKGESCQEADGGHSHAPVVLGVFFLVVLVGTGIFIFSKRREWAALRKRSADKENLMANMGLPSEDESSDSEELESPVDTQPPSLPLVTVAENDPPAFTDKPVTG